MRRTLLWLYLLGLCVLALNLSAADAVSGCRGCAVGKKMLQCDYYVKRLGDLRHQDACETYAKTVDIDGSHAKAAWYYLLAGKPDKALTSAQQAMKQGHTFAAEYAAFAAKILHQDAKARHYLAQFHKFVKNGGYMKKDVEALKKIYKNVDFSEFMK